MQEWDEGHVGREKGNRGGQSGLGEESEAERQSKKLNLEGVRRQNVY